MGWSEPPRRGRNTTSGPRESDRPLEFGDGIRRHVRDDFWEPLSLLLRLRRLRWRSKKVIQERSKKWSKDDPKSDPKADQKPAQKAIQKLPKSWSKTGQKLAKKWPKTGQKVIQKLTQKMKKRWDQTPQDIWCQIQPDQTIWFKLIKPSHFPARGSPPLDSCFLSWSERIQKMAQKVVQKLTKKLAKSWSKTGQKLAKNWPKTGPKARQKLVETWSKTDPKSGPKSDPKSDLNDRLKGDLNGGPKVCRKLFKSWPNAGPKFSKKCSKSGTRKRSRTHEKDSARWAEGDVSWRIPKSLPLAAVYAMLRKRARKVIAMRNTLAQSPSRLRQSIWHCGSIRAQKCAGI